MPTPQTTALDPPQDWNEFENICAELFSLIWDDRNTHRYGRSGRRQNGVDIFGRPSSTEKAGVQCKGKRKWPPAKMTKAEITNEVRKARKFKPSLTDFTIVTTASDDAALQDHANAITERHLQRGLFKVTVLGWEELSRRIKRYPMLLENYYGYQNIPEKTAELVVQKITSLSDEKRIDPSAGVSPISFHDRESRHMTDAIERDFERRLTEAIWRDPFPEVSSPGIFQGLAKELVDSHNQAVSSSVQRKLFLFAAKEAAVHNQSEIAKGWFNRAIVLDGTSSHFSAQARILESEGDVDGAIMLLRDLTDSDSRSALLSILARHKGDDIALEWYESQSLTVSDLTPGGILALCMVYLRKEDIQAIDNLLALVSDAQLDQYPYLRYFRGIIALSIVFPKSDRLKPLAGDLLDVRHARPLLTGQQLARQIDSAVSDFQHALPIIRQANLRLAGRIVEAFLRWCELMHPIRKEQSLNRLRVDILDPTIALPLLPFAFAYDAEFNPGPIINFIEKREALGGLNDVEFRAAFILRLHRPQPRAVAEFIAKDRSRCEATFGRSHVLAIEIQALAISADTISARLMLDEHRPELEATLVAFLEAEISKAEGSDPVVEYKRVFDETNETEALRALVSALIDKKDHKAAATYAEVLYARNSDPYDILVAARAYANAGDELNFGRVVRDHPLIVEQDERLRVHYAWYFFREGKFDAAHRIIDGLRDSSVRDLDLEIAVAIESGDWDGLTFPLTEFRNHAERYSGLQLIRAANLSYAAGRGSFRDLLTLAVERAGDDPHVLLGAYLLVTEADVVELRSPASRWFALALDTSGPNGPVKRFQLRELLAQQVKWNDQVRRINQGVFRGEIPFVVAAPGLRQTSVELVLKNIVQNVRVRERRRKIPIPLFSGRHSPAVVETANTIAFDISALMVLGWLGLLPKVLSLCTSIVIPAGALFELFDGSRRLREFQASRLRNATQIRDEIAQKRIKVLSEQNSSRDRLCEEIGEELASLLRAAKSSKAMVVRPAPVHRLTTDDVEVDLSEHTAYLTDVRSLLGVLTDFGAIDQSTEQLADQYIKVQDKGWDFASQPKIERPLFLDALTLVYLQSVDLLPSVLSLFKDVYIHSSVEEEAFAIIDHVNNAAEVAAIIEKIRLWIRAGIQQGNVTFGARRHDAAGDDDSSTLHLLTDLVGIDCVAFDDRALNKDRFAQDALGNRSRVVSTLDFIEDLRSKNIIDDDEWRGALHRLRLAGATLVPIKAEEITFAVRRSRGLESAELRAIRESIYLARANEIPQFPAEIPWFASASTAFKTALMRIWEDEPDPARAAQQSDTILSLYLNAEDWVSCWGGNAPPGWIAAVKRVRTLGLSLPIELKDRPLDAYLEWLDRTIVAPLQLTAPKQYQELVDDLRSFIQRHYIDAV